MDETKNHPKQLQNISMPLTQNEVGVIRRIREIKAKGGEMVIVEIKNNLFHCRTVGKLEGQGKTVG